MAQVNPRAGSTGNADGLAEFNLVADDDESQLPNLLLDPGQTTGQRRELRKPKKSPTKRKHI